MPLFLWTFMGFSLGFASSYIGEFFSTPYLFVAIFAAGITAGFSVLILRAPEREGYRLIVGMCAIIIAASVRPIDNLILLLIGRQGMGILAIGVAMGMIISMFAGTMISRMKEEDAGQE